LNRGSYFIVPPVTCDPSNDPNCTTPPGTQGEGNCIDGIDNDGDGFQIGGIIMGITLKK